MIEDLRVGDALPAIERGPISRATLALFAGASNDHSPLHIDSDFVKSVGIRDVFAHGMLVMAYMGHLLTGLVPLDDLRRWKVRFVSITPVHATVRCSATMMAIFVQDGERRAVLELIAQLADGTTVLTGEATIALR